MTKEILCSEKLYKNEVSLWLKQEQISTSTSGKMILIQREKHYTPLLDIFLVLSINIHHIASQVNASYFKNI